MGDIQTLANPTPYLLRVGGYLETFEFRLNNLCHQNSSTVSGIIFTRVT